MGDLNSENLLTGLALYAVLTALAVWATLVLWSWQDAGLRSRSTTLRFLVAILVAVLNVPGLFIYLMLRPRETLGESYERSLEEEVLLQGIVERMACPTCKAHTRPDWQLCPACNTRLRRPCTRCGNLLESDWERCPWCASRQPLTREEDWSITPQRVRPAAAGGTGRASAVGDVGQQGEGS